MTFTWGRPLDPHLASPLQGEEQSARCGMVSAPKKKLLPLQGGGRVGVSTGRAGERWVSRRSTHPTFSEWPQSTESWVTLYQSKSIDFQVSFGALWLGPNSTENVPFAAKICICRSDTMIDS